MNIYKLLKGCLLLLGLSVMAIGCTDDETNFTNSQGGYVQFKLYKSASYDKRVSLRAGNNQLDFLNEAKKMKVSLLKEGETKPFSQTMLLNAYDAENAEFGLRSDKLNLAEGTYTVLAYYLYGKVEDQIFVGSPTETMKFTVTSGGLVVKDLLVDVQPRGLVNFKLVKNLLAGTKTAEGNKDEAYPFSSIDEISLTIRDVATQTNLPVIKDLEVEYTEDYKGDGEGKLTSYGEIDSLISLKSGTYRIISYEAKQNNGTLQYFADKVDGVAEFTVKDNEIVKVDVPITLLETAANIQDYLALKAIWQALDGPNWSYKGESYPAGTNWDFEKDIDMWGEQPGVVLDKNGRVSSLSLGDFGAKGKIPDAIGQLSELKTLALGTHNDFIKNETVDPNNPIDPSCLKGQLTETQLKNMRDDYMNRFVMHDIREDLSEPLKLGMKIKGDYNSAVKGVSVSPKDVVWGDLTNGIDGISPAIGKLKKLEVLYIANAPIETLPEASTENPEYQGMIGLEACTDLEIYNCPYMKKFPTVIAQMKELIQINLAMNKQMSGAEFTEGLRALANGKSKDKIQILYLGHNNIEELPDNINQLTKLGKIDCVYNKLKKLPAFGPDVNLVQAAFDYNQIEEIETMAISDENGAKEVFCGMEDVENLSFSHNKLKKLPNIFDVNSIYTMASVDFSYNEIGDDGLKDFEGINTSNLSLAGNKLEHFPGVLFEKGSPLTVLNLSANKISTFEDEDLKGDKTYLLTTLDLTYNKLSKLPDAFNGHILPYLYGLDLSGNRLTGFPWGAANISYLTVLALRNQRDDDGNRVYKEWPASIAEHKGLRALFLGGNNIGKVPDTETISYLIYTLDVSDNPNLILNVSDVCAYIKSGIYMLIYDRTQDIRGCDALDLE